MNKKVYIAPMLRVVIIHRHPHILSGSSGITISESAADKSGTVLSPQGDFCGDDEDF